MLRRCDKCGQFVGNHPVYMVRAFKPCTPDQWCWSDLYRYHHAYVECIRCEGKRE